MFYHKQHNTYGMFFLLSLVLAFLLGRKSERYGLSIVSRGCDCYEEDDDEMDMMDIPTNNTYPQ